jgi:hypothetical protein
MKALIAILTVVAIASLAVNFLLIYRLHQTGETAKKWKKAHQQLFLQTQKENQELYRAEKQRSASQTTRTSQPENIASLPQRPSQSTAESSTHLNHAAIEKADVYRQEIKFMLTEALDEEFPDLDLKETEIEDLTDAVITIRDSMQNLRSVERSGENVELINELQEQRDQAMLDFERITGKSALEFMRRAPAEGGIDKE